MSCTNIILQKPQSEQEEIAVIVYFACQPRVSRLFLTITHIKLE